MQSDKRLARLQELIKEAEGLAKEEAHLQHQERRLTRLAACLWICRDVVDEVVEATIIAPDPPDGRPEREHF